MVTIYRIAHKEHFGSGLYSSCTSRNMFEKLRHPDPEQDSKLMRNFEGSIHSNYFGFASLEQLKFWVYREEWRVSLLMEGYQVYLVKPLGKYFLGDTQAMFHRESYEVTGAMSLDCI